MRTIISIYLYIETNAAKSFENLIFNLKCCLHCFNCINIIICLDVANWKVVILSNVIYTQVELLEIVNKCHFGDIFLGLLNDTPQAVFSQCYFKLGFWRSCRTIRLSKDAYRVYQQSLHRCILHVGYRFFKNARGCIRMPTSSSHRIL